MSAQRIFVSFVFGLWLVLGGVAEAQFQPTLHGEPNLMPLTDLPTPHIDAFLTDQGKDFDLTWDEIFADVDDRFKHHFYMALRQDSQRAGLYRPKLIDYLVYSLTDESGLIWQDALLSLSHDEEDAFSDASHDMLRRMEGPKHSGGWTRLLGAANIPEVIDYAREYLDASEEFEGDTEAWLCRLVLAKYGDDEAIQQVVETALNTPGWFNRTPLPRDLLYIRQPEIVELYQEVLFSDDIMEFDHAPSFPVRTSAIQAIAAMVADFPLERKQFAFQYTDEEVELIREWAAGYERPWRVLYQRVDLRENPEDFPWAVEQQRMREVERETREREWRERKNGSFPEEEQLPEDEPAIDGQPETPAMDEARQGNRGGLSPVRILSIALLLLAFGSAVLLFVRRKQG